MAPATPLRSSPRTEPMAMWHQQPTAERASRWCLLCKECACLCRKLGAPTSADGLVGRMASSTATNTSAAAKLAAAAAHPLDPVTVRTGTPSTGTIASAPGVFTSASPCHPASNRSMPRFHPRHTPRRTRRHITLRELSTAREPETVCGNAAVLSHGLDNPTGCPHSHRPTTRSLRSLSIIHQPIIPVSPTLAPLYQFYPDLPQPAVPLLSRHSH
jgi:hypothetical protein